MVWPQPVLFECFEFMPSCSPLPHPFRTAGTCDTCFITKDISKEKNFDQDRGTDRFKELLRRGGVEGITEVRKEHSTCTVHTYRNCGTSLLRGAGRG